MFFDFNAMIIGGSVKAAKLFLYKISQDFNPESHSAFLKDQVKDEKYESKYRIYSKTIRGFLFFFSQKLRITFECGLHSSADFIFFFLKRFPIRPK